MQKVLSGIFSTLPVCDICSQLYYNFEKFNLSAFLYGIGGLCVVEHRAISEDKNAAIVFHQKSCSQATSSGNELVSLVPVEFWAWCGCYYSIQRCVHPSFPQPISQMPHQASCFPAIPVFCLLPLDPRYFIGPCLKQIMFAVCGTAVNYLKC